jgi:hypothetical protein
MRLFRFAAAVGVAAVAACSVVNSVDDPVPANNDSGTGGATPIGCPEGFEVCSGACVRTDNDPANCGACGTACAENQVCGLSQCLTSCPEDMTGCDGSCVDLQTDPMHCGTCDGACSAGDNAHGTCTAGECGVECDAGFDSCDVDPSDCEINIDSDPENCGVCGTGCIARANAAPSCTAGVCGLGACDVGFDNCDGFEETGCEADIDNSVQHCSQCGMACTGANAFCIAGACTTLFWASGVQQNLPIASLQGWQQCYLETYGTSGTAVDDMLTACSGDALLVGCRLTGSATLQVAAMALRDDVLTDCAEGAPACGGAGDCTHVANGVGWYFNDSLSMGYVQAGEPVQRCSCDTASTQPATRVCWHTSGGDLTGGYRCGADTGLGNTYERIVFHHP